VKAQEASQDRVKAHLVVSGDPKQVGAWFAEFDERARWTVDVDTTARGVRFVRLSADGNMPYRFIGGAIYSAQVRQLVVGFQLEPRICELEEE
jgi:hypothetical protein